MNILIIDDELNIRKTMTVCLETDGHVIVSVSNYEDAIAENLRHCFDIAFVDIRLGMDSGLDLIPVLLAESPWLKIVMITAYASIDTAVDAMRRGATDYIPKPFTPTQLKLVVQKIAEVRSLEQRIDALQADLNRINPEVDLTTASPVMQRAIELARQAAPTDAIVLITGENGTGKSIIARAIHSWSKRSDKPFAEISCPSLSPDLLESELFGHVKGSFTGAVRDHSGRIAFCEGGTLLLDEVGDLPLSVQPRLLRFLQEREYERLGDHATQKANVRLIAATNMNLEEAVKDQRFREDLYYRLSVIQIEIPPLRERPEDVVNLAKRWMTFFSRSNHRASQQFSKDALQALERYSWPGNVRELRNVVERASILSRSELVGIEYLPEKFLTGIVHPKLGDLVSLEKIEEMHIRHVLASTKSLQEAADILGIDQATLWRRRKQYNI
ncbi:MAG: sigma-54 dependent transcriptional regulator [Syntrophales bacterium]|jgi:NtrC-family two-component system response regulator AlgB